MRVCVHVRAVLGSPEDLDSLELDLQIAVSCHMGSGNQIQVLCKSNKLSYPLSQFSSLSPCWVLEMEYQAANTGWLFKGKAEAKERREEEKGEEERKERSLCTVKD